jgi:hypothetical protein
LSRPPSSAGAIGSPTSGSPPRVRVRQAYRPRNVRFLELWQPDDWLVKLYGLAYDRDRPAAATIAAAKRAAARALPRPARSDDRYGIAVVIVHHGQDACWLLVDWWGQESVLHQRLLTAPLPGDGSFHPAPPELAACVWELPLLMFERNAWVETVLADAARSDVGRYLGRRFQGEV